MAPVKAPFLVAEHLAFQQAGGNGGAIQLDEGALAARAEVVDGARQQFLAGAGFAVDQHRGIGGRDGLHLLQNGLQRAALADDLLEAVVGADFVFEVDLLFRQARVQLLDALVGKRVFERDGHLAGRLREELQVPGGEEVLLARAQVERAQRLAVRDQRACSRWSAAPRAP